MELDYVRVWLRYDGKTYIKGRRNETKTSNSHSMITLHLVTVLLVAFVPKNRLRNEKNEINIILQFLPICLFTIGVWFVDQNWCLGYCVPSELFLPKP